MKRGKKALMWERDSCKLGCKLWPRMIAKCETVMSYQAKSLKVNGQMKYALLSQMGVSLAFKGTVLELILIAFRARLNVCVSEASGKCSEYPRQ